MISSDVAERWRTANHRYLFLALAEVRRTLRTHLGIADPEEAQDPEQVLAELAEELNQGGVRPSLDVLCEEFGLSDFERQVLLLCAGVELDASFAPLCAMLNGDSAGAFPTFAVAFAALATPHWSAVGQLGPLRHWRLVELEESQTATTARRLRISERILSYLLGVPDVDERLVDLIEAWDTSGTPVASHAALAARVVDVWSSAGDGQPLPGVQLCGTDTASKRAVATAAAVLVDMDLLCVRAQPLLDETPARADLLVLCEREALLQDSILFVDADDVETSEPGRESSLARLAGRLHRPHLLASRQRFSSPLKPMVAFDVEKPTAQEQRGVWRACLGIKGKQSEVWARRLATQFNLGASTIQTAALLASSGQSTGSGMVWRVWDECRAQTRRELDLVAERIGRCATWDDLVVPEPQQQRLREIAIHVRHRQQVYDAWGFADKSSRGLGISALFAGPSGTGKTMAAEVLASELRLDLYRVDLSATVSKYIGETEKNLRRIFDAADAGGAILLFDEADALFGKRSEVKDSHDRYANIEISYLLQRLESYRGLAILTTNMKDALDRAFLRRIRFVVEFPFPDSADRERIWQRVFPSQTPTEGLDLKRLARLNVTGANIRSIAMNAAFLAAEAAEPVRMEHVLSATRGEYVKLEKPLTDVDMVAKER
ncbi:MAG TPA: ATP-binding protein [Chloroflexota bacterium]